MNELTAEDIKPLLDMKLGDLCPRCNKWFEYSYTQKPGELPMILGGDQRYCSKLCEETQ